LIFPQVTEYPATEPSDVRRKDPEPSIVETSNVLHVTLVEPDGCRGSGTAVADNSNKLWQCFPLASHENLWKCCHPPELHMWGEGKMQRGITFYPMSTLHLTAFSVLHKSRHNSSHHTLGHHHS
jgi:hypothetical protein